MNINSGKNILISERSVKIFLTIFFSGLILSAFRILPYDDSYYYWDWGRHLDLSYFDGAPLIAYLMRLFSLIFGSTTYAINLLGVSTLLLTSFFIYQTGILLFDKRIALNACLLWLLSTLVIPFLFLWVTYDNPLVIFWAMTIYFVVKYIQQKKTQDLYWIGCSVGLLLLSKYTGIVLLLGLFFFILGHPRYRGLFFNKHFYFSFGVALLISSPVFVWNFQHNWISFTYQLQHRGLPPGWLNVIFYVEKLFSQYNILFIIPLFGFFHLLKSRSKEQDGVLLLHIISITFILFFLYQSVTAHILRHWLTPFTISAALLCSYYFAKFKLRKLFLMTLMVYFGLSFFSVMSFSFFQKNVDGNTAEYTLAKVAGEKYLKPNSIIVTSFWEAAARMLFWLPNKPQIYTLPCGRENQYAFWSADLLQKIKQKKIAQVLYMDFEDNGSCIQQFFSQCKPLSTLVYENPNFKFHEKKTQRMFIYECRN